MMWIPADPPRRFEPNESVAQTTGANREYLVVAGPDINGDYAVVRHGELSLINERALVPCARPTWPWS